MLFALNMVWLEVKIISHYKIANEYRSEYFVDSHLDILVPFFNMCYSFNVWISNEFGRYLLELIDCKCISNKANYDEGQTPYLEVPTAIADVEGLLADMLIILDIVDPNQDEDQYCKLPKDEVISGK
jgi:hypothetical protein